MPPEQKSEEGGSPGATADDLKRIGAMLRAARDARTIIGDLDAASLGRDMVRTRAAVNCFTEIGEAASRLTPGGRALVGEFPWRQIVGVRNNVVHVYWGIDLAVVVKACRDDLPGLIGALERVFAAGTSGENGPSDA